MARKREFDKAAWMLTRERFQLTHEVPPCDDSSVSIRDVLGGIFKRIEAARRPWLDDLDSEWSNLMDDLVAGHARPAGLRGRTVIIHVDSSAWLSDLVRFKRDEMLRRLKERFGDRLVANISMKIGPLAPPREARQGRGRSG